jgi:hypothetical protein
MERTYNKNEISYMNTKYGGNWIRTPEKDCKDYVLYATGNATMSGRIYVALPNKPLTNEDKIKYNIM